MDVHSLKTNDTVKTILWSYNTCDAVSSEGFQSWGWDHTVGHKTPSEGSCEDFKKTNQV